MRWLFRPSSLVVVSAALALSAMALVVWPRQLGNKAAALAVEDGDQEIVWLYAATSPANWERFVRGVRTVVEKLQKDSPQLGIELNEQDAFPAETTAVPEVVLSANGVQGKLRFRWYKLTSDQKTPDWVKGLLERRPPPLAIIGGSSSDLGLDLARSLKREAEQNSLGDAAPLLLLTTATVDDDSAAGDQPLTDIYPGRTYRFCFTNRQMAEAVVAFIWGQNELRPDGDPVYLTYWKDDPYSKDLVQRYLDALEFPATIGATRDWARVAGCALLGGMPLDSTLAYDGAFRLAMPYPSNIPFSVGTFGRPNRWEVLEGGRLIEWKLQNHPKQERPLLVLPAATQPSRRFLRALVRFAPVEARHFVVATGDAIAFNTLYRDRNFAWPIQDLPFKLVCFCHRNPVDSSVGFDLKKAERGAELNNSGPTPARTDDLLGTEDLLLYMDILDALVQASFCKGSAALPANAKDLRGKLSQTRWSKLLGRVVSNPASPFLFDDKGNRRSGTGEHVVYLRPSFRGREVLPAATIQVWAWDAGHSAHQPPWRLQATIPVHYGGYDDQE
jgi:hypothetical protein